jgi:hypothetical protein
MLDIAFDFDFESESEIAEIAEKEGFSEKK